MSVTIGRILSGASPRKIGDTGVRLVSIKMAYLLAINWRRKECGSNQSMYCHPFALENPG